MTEGPNIPWQQNVEKGRSGMNRLAKGGIAVAVLALILSLIGLMPGTPEHSHDDNREAGREEAITGLTQQVASLEAKIEELSSRQTALAALADKPEPRVERAAPADYYILWVGC